MERATWKVGKYWDGTCLCLFISELPGSKPLEGMRLYSKPRKELWIGGGDWVSVLTSCVLDESPELPETGCFLSGLSVYGPCPSG